MSRNILEYKDKGYLPPEVQRLQYIYIRISGTGVTQSSDIVLITNVLFYWIYTYKINKNNLHNDLPNLSVTNKLIKTVSTK